MPAKYCQRSPHGGRRGNWLLCFGFISSALFTTCSWLFAALQVRFLIFCGHQTCLVLVIEGAFNPLNITTLLTQASALQWTKEGLCHTPLGQCSVTACYILKKKILKGLFCLSFFLAMLQCYGRAILGFPKEPFSDQSVFKSTIFFFF